MRLFIARLAHAPAFLFLLAASCWGASACSSSQEILAITPPADIQEPTSTSLTLMPYLWSPVLDGNVCLAISPRSAAQGTGVELVPCDNSNTQLWSFSNGAFKTVGNQCLSVASQKSATDLALDVAECEAGQATQQWAREGNGLIYNETLCLDFVSEQALSAARVQLARCAANSPTQQWTTQATFTPTPAIGAQPSPVAINTNTNTAINTNATVQMAQAAQDLNTLMPLASQSTASKLTVMGSRFDGVVAHVLTASEAKFFADASAQPPALGDTHKFPVTLYPSGLPSPADIMQHAIGDCDGVSIMASLAYMNPTYITKIIRDNGNSTYTVAMYDPKGQPISISVDTLFLAYDANTVAAATGQNGEANWATVIEKAVMKYLVVWPMATIGGIGSEHLLPMLTGAGDSFAFGTGVLSPEQFQKAVKSSLAQGMFVTGGFQKELTAGKAQSITAHGYAVFVPADANTMASMRNPWGYSPLTTGGGDASTHGVLDVPMSTTWSSMMDLRLIVPGAAASSGRMTPYTVSKSLAAALGRAPLRVTEPHALARARSSLSKE